MWLMKQAYVSAILVLVLLALSCERHEDVAIGEILTVTPTNVPVYSEISSVSPASESEEPIEVTSVVLAPTPNIPATVQSEVNLQ